VSSVTCGEVAAPPLSRKAKAVLARRIAPWTRHFLGLIPSGRARELVWERVIDPRIYWREFDFASRTYFNAKVVGNTADIIQRTICYFGVWEPNLTAWIADRLNPGDLFLDIGANIGYFSLLASQIVGRSGRVVAIEPSPPTFGFLQRNLSLNRVRNVRAVNVAVSDREEELDLFLHSENDSGSATGVHKWASQQGFVRGSRVRALPLNSILESGEIEAARLIKIDVEGYEGHILPDLLQLLPRCRRDAEIIVEVTPSALAQEGRTSSQMLDGFISQGFHLYEIENDYSVESYVQAGRPKRPLRLVNSMFSGQKDLILSRECGEVI
jgi:FkbM family methyltransferase